MEYALRDVVPIAPVAITDHEKHLFRISGEIRNRLWVVRSKVRRGIE